MPDFIPPLRGLILDMDGVLWRADQAIGNLGKIFASIQRQNLRVVLATNNSTLTINQYLEKIANFGARLERWQIVTSSQVVAHTLLKEFPSGGPVFILGEDGLVEALQETNFYHSEKSPQAVAVGMDRGLNYEKLARAALLIRSGLPFIATNPDRTFPTPLGLVPGTGAFILALEAATERKANVVGKPEPEMYRVALQRLGTQPEETLVVGDRLETDIVGAQVLGCRTALVLSGVTSEERALRWKPGPEFIAADLTSLLEIL